jgi:uncharacterized metal-binding protein
MAKSTPDFSIKVGAVKGFCPAGEVHAKQNIAEKKIPVLACEGPCIRGEIARLVANRVSEETPYARCCYAETLLVPHSTMTTWVREAEQVIVIDGCFLSCIGRILENVIDKDKMINIDTNPMHKKYSDVFLYTDVTEDERNDVASKVADKVLQKLTAEQVAVA